MTKNLKNLEIYQLQYIQNDAGAAAKQVNSGKMICI